MEWVRSWPFSAGADVLCIEDEKRESYVKGLLETKDGRCIRLVETEPHGLVPEAADCLVLEEDRFLVLSTKEPRTEPAGVVGKLVSQAMEVLRDSPLPGHILTRGMDPLCLLAVVYDFEADPPSCLDWVRGALEESLVEAKRHGVRTLRTPILGARWGPVSEEDFIRALREAVGDLEGGSLEAIFVDGLE